MKTRYALISVFHKEGIVEFAKKLVSLGWKIISSSNTAKAIKAGGLEVLDVSDIIQAATKKMIINIISELQNLNVIALNTNDLTLDNIVDQIMKRLNIGTPILDHRVATLYSYIHAAILARRNELADIDELKKLGVEPIDLVCVDFYPLEQTINKEGVTEEEVVRLTDIGGPTLLSSAAKNRLIVIGDPADRNRVIEYLEAGEPNHEEHLVTDEPSYESLIDYLVAKAHYIVSKYRLLSAIYHSQRTYAGFIGTKFADCKYGENPWMTPAAIYSITNDDPLGMDKFRLIEGTDPSFINWTDVDSALQTITHIVAGYEVNFGYVPLTAVGVKHGNACGAAVGDESVETISKMIKGNPIAIFGGTIVTNFGITDQEAWQILTLGMEDKKRVVDCIAAPFFSEQAIEILSRKHGKCRLLENKALLGLNKSSLDQNYRFRYVRGGFLSQPNYTHILEINNCYVLGDLDDNVSKDLILGWAVGSTSTSNTITLVKDSMLIGNGVGQQDRRTAAQLAVMIAKNNKHELAGSVAYSDSYFPFTDGPQVLSDNNVLVILASSGSINDEKIKEFCLEKHVCLCMIPDKEARGFCKH